MEKNELIKLLKVKSIDEILQDSTDSYVLYHLSERRANFLSVIDFNKNDNVLEISFDCEIITKYYENKVKSIDKVSLNIDIEKIIYSNSKNITLLENINKISNNYDKIILVGAIENIDKYFNGTVIEFIKLLANHLNNDGSIIIATSNKYSIKYLSGAKNENSSNYFEQIENNNNLLSRNELKNIISKVKMESYFYYPLPDYYFASEIYSDEYLPTMGCIKNISTVYNDSKYVIFDEEKALNEAIRSNEFETFAPSFIVVMNK